MADPKPGPVFLSVPTAQDLWGAGGPQLPSPDISVCQLLLAGLFLCITYTEKSNCDWVGRYPKVFQNQIELEEGKLATVFTHVKINVK